MEAIIRLRPEELTEDFFKQLKLMARSSKRIEIKLDDVDALNNLSEKEIEERLRSFEEGQTISFTMEEFEAYTHKITG